MADKIAKLLRRLPPKQLRLLLPIVQQIADNNLAGLDVKVLKGHNGLYRMQAGNYRVIFTMQSSQHPNIIAIAKRDEKTYKGL